MRLHVTGMAVLTVAAAALLAGNAAAFSPADVAGAGAERSEIIQVAQPKKPPQRYWRTKVRFRTDEAPGTIIVDTNSKYLYYIDGRNRATRYGIGVGRDGFGWSGVVKVGRKAEWPSWTPPAEMRVRERAKGRILPITQPGGIDNPLGARALYLYKGGRDTIFRIHGTNQPWTIGQNMSSGCIRMMNEDVEHLYERAGIGTKVIVIGPGSKPGDTYFDDRGVDIFRTIFGG
ncbi:L,D-transpeptidase family protein [Sinorhizobium medicae]|uniref:ErfK/YbiS/YcfS/YnhG family protein n=1 Tax=Sinorhizobium medicae TaxID=110321 RepID=A0A508X3M3_9HYPH|nr:L,D-transpeptidase [Sinorhizobium medicae]MBO1939314.1 L,D-transpeptidase [Sinorhizobium medicae]MDX0426794.1 L,D-transpeptidase family protein [Sinorhizobium medicae]MDX0432816.1 L,D-transpeptidase family protein [Sinorhizobium medicae]MDX0445455.1 L,D-transpeptidase family protein [Sinorhizobium medicae]MDX0451265.1 L,D-transpeptidase family protein [Sinorhizobium medicae]